MYYNFIVLQKQKIIIQKIICAYLTIFSFFTISQFHTNNYLNIIFFYPNIKYSCNGVPCTLLFVPLQNFYGHLTHFCIIWSCIEHAKKLKCLRRKLFLFPNHWPLARYKLLINCDFVLDASSE